jgi:tetratricopeptide (TPR) repeat protein
MKHFIILILIAGFFCSGCKKQLDTKPDSTLVTPGNSTDVQALLDYAPVMLVNASADEASADDYFLPATTFNGLSSNAQRGIYTWDKDHFFTGPSSEWGVLYAKVYYCNIALETLSRLAPSATNDNLRGQALFKRGRTFWQVANIWTLPYDASSAVSDLGIPLRLNSNFEEQSMRASVSQTYERIIKDLKTAIPLLPEIVASPIRPSRPAAYGMLSRVYLSMRNYQSAKLYADSALALSGALLDYNTVNASPSLPFSLPNPEVLSYSYHSNALVGPSNARMDTVLLALYDVTDLRKALYFRSRPGGLWSFKGSYANYSLFAGIATDELYLTRAECYARAGLVDEALADLNMLLVNRYKTGTFVAVTAVTPGQALDTILQERRKELIMRTRWMDLRRLNKEGAGIVLRRLENNISYELLPGSQRYALPLPEDVIAISGMKQNPR